MNNLKCIKLNLNVGTYASILKYLVLGKIYFVNGFITAWRFNINKQ